MSALWTRLTARLICLPVYTTVPPRKSDNVLQPNNIPLTSASGGYLNPIHYQQTARLSISVQPSVVTLHLKEDCSARIMVCSGEVVLIIEPTAAVQAWPLRNGSVSMSPTDRPTSHSYSCSLDVARPRQKTPLLQWGKLSLGGLGWSCHWTATLTTASIK